MVEALDALADAAHSLLRLLLSVLRKLARLLARAEDELEEEFVDSGAVAAAALLRPRTPVIATMLLDQPVGPSC